MNLICTLTEGNGAVNKIHWDFITCIENMYSIFLGIISTRQGNSHIDPFSSSTCSTPKKPCWLRQAVASSREVEGKTNPHNLDEAVDTVVSWAEANWLTRLLKDAKGKGHHHDFFLFSKCRNFEECVFCWGVFGLPKK